MNTQTQIGRIRYSLAGEKACPACDGTGHPEAIARKYYDDDAGCWLPDYCDDCSGLGLVAIVCDHCEGPVSVNGYCHSCEQSTQVQGFRPVFAADLEIGLEA